MNCRDPKRGCVVYNGIHRAEEPQIDNRDCPSQKRDRQDMDVLDDRVDQVRLANRSCEPGVVNPLTDLESGRCAFLRQRFLAKLQAL